MSHIRMSHVLIQTCDSRQRYCDACIGKYYGSLLQNIVSFMGSFEKDTCLIQMCDMTRSHSHLWHDETTHASFARVTWLVYTCIAIHVSFTCVTCLIMSQVWMRMSHVTRMHKECVAIASANEASSARTWMSHVTCKCSHLTASCHTLKWK